MLVRDRSDRIHFGNDAEDVDGKQDAGPWRDGVRDRVGVNVPGCGVDVDKHRLGAFEECAVGGGNEGERRRNDFIAGLNAHGAETQVEPTGTAADGGCISCTDKLGDVRLELRQLGAEGEVGGVQDLVDGIAFGLCDVGTCKGDFHPILRFCQAV